MKRAEISGAMIPTVSIELVKLEAGDVQCASCHQRPRVDQGQPLAVWIGKPSFRAPAVCVCHLCLTIALVSLGFDLRDLVDIAQMIEDLDTKVRS